MQVVARQLFGQAKTWTAQTHAAEIEPEGNGFHLGVMGRRFHPAVVRDHSVFRSPANDVGRAPMTGSRKRSFPAIPPRARRGRSSSWHGERNRWRNRCQSSATRVRRVPRSGKSSASLFEFPAAAFAPLTEEEVSGFSGSWQCARVKVERSRGAVAWLRCGVTLASAEVKGASAEVKPAGRHVSAASAEVEPASLQVKVASTGVKLASYKVKQASGEVRWDCGLVTPLDGASEVRPVFPTSRAEHGASRLGGSPSANGSASRLPGFPEGHSGTLLPLQHGGTEDTEVHGEEEPGLLCFCSGCLCAPWCTLCLCV